MSGIRNIGTFITFNADGQAILGVAVVPAGFNIDGATNEIVVNVTPADRRMLEQRKSSVFSYSCVAGEDGLVFTHLEQVSVLSGKFLCYTSQVKNNPNQHAWGVVIEMPAFPGQQITILCGSASQVPAGYKPGDSLMLAMGGEQTFLFFDYAGGYGVALQAYEIRKGARKANPYLTVLELQPEPVKLDMAA